MLNLPTKSAKGECSGNNDKLNQFGSGTRKVLVLLWQKAVLITLFRRSGNEVHISIDRGSICCIINRTFSPKEMQG
jgi:hypothetical protein